MVHIEGEIVINRPVDEVFDFVADERNEPRYNPSMLRSDQTSTGPIGLGTTFRAESKMMGRTVETVIECTGYDPPRLLASRSRSSFGPLPATEIQGTLTFEPAPRGTRMRWSWRIKTPGLLKPMTPLIARMGKRQEETIWTNLKHLLEEQSVPSPPT
jgi:hypothetical protein